MITEEDISRVIQEALEDKKEYKVAEKIGLSKSGFTNFKSNYTKGIVRFVNLMDILGLEIKDFKNK